VWPAGLLTVLAKSIAYNDTNTLYAESIADTNTDTFAKSIGDTFTPVLLPTPSCLSCKR